MSRNYIADGQTRDGYINAVERLHDECSFRYRPMLPAITETVENSIVKESPPIVIAIIAEVCARHLVEWSEVDDKGKPIPCRDKASLERITHPVLLKLYRIIAGMRASDPRPLSAPEPAENAQDVARAILDQAGGKIPGVELMERVEGN